MTKPDKLPAVNLFPTSHPALTSSAARLSARNSFATLGRAATIRTNCQDRGLFN